MATAWNKGLKNPRMVEWNRSQKMRDVARKRMLQSNPMKVPEIVDKVSGENNYQWKGNDVSYDALHDWVERHKGKASKCSFDPQHKATRFNWANVSGSYLRDLDDYVELRPTCHNQYDNIRRGYLTPRGRIISNRILI